MRRRKRNIGRIIVRDLMVTCLAVLIAGLINFWPGANLGWMGIDKDFAIQLGVDVQGGTDLTLQAQFAPGTPDDVQATMWHNAVRIITQVVDTEARDVLDYRPAAPPVQRIQVETLDNHRIAVALPGMRNPQPFLAALRGNGLNIIDHPSNP